MKLERAKFGIGDVVMSSENQGPTEKVRWKIKAVYGSPGNIMYSGVIVYPEALKGRQIQRYQHLITLAPTQEGEPESLIVIPTVESIVNSIKEQIDQKSLYCLMANAHPTELEYLESKIWDELSKIFKKAYEGNA